MLKKMVGRIATVALAAVCALSVSACAPRDSGNSGDGNNEPVDVRDTLESCTVNILFAVQETPYDADAVERAVNNQLKKDGKPYEVHFEYTAHNNYSVTIGDYCKQGYDGAWSHVTNIQSLISQEIIKTNLGPYLDVWGQDIKADVKDYQFAQFTDIGTGNIYAIPRDMPTADDRARVTIRADWMEQAGLDSVKSVAELDDYLSYCQEANSGTDGFYALMLGEQNAHLLREYCPSYYFPIQDGSYSIYIDINDPTYTVKSMYTTEAFSAWVAKAKEYVLNGYVSTQNISSTENYFYNGLSAALPSYSVVKMSERVDAFKQANPEGELYEVFFESENNKKVVFFGADNCMVALSQSKHTEEFIDFLNWTKDQDNHDLVCFGVEGTNYYLTDDGRFSYVNPDNESETIPVSKRYAIYNPYYAFNDIDYLRFSANLSDEYVDSVVNCQKNDESGNPENYILSPLCGFNVQETEAYKTAHTKVTNAIAAFTGLTNGKGELSEIAGLIASAQAAGIDELIAEVQRQVNEYLQLKNG